MPVTLVSYDLKKPGQNYQKVYDYLKSHTYCKGLESVWLLDTDKSTETIRDELKDLIDQNDILFVVRLKQDWASYKYYCADWLNKTERTF